MRLDRSKNIMRKTSLKHIRIPRNDVMALISALFKEYPKAIGIIIFHDGIASAENGMLNKNVKVKDLIKEANENGHYILVEKGSSFVPRF